jgi:hypothetical protein
MLSKSTLVLCKEWNIIQSGKLVVTCEDGQYIIVINICPLLFHSTLLVNVECIINFKCNLILSKASNIILNGKHNVAYGDGQYFRHTYLLNI